MQSRPTNVGYFEINAVFNWEPVELLDESTWTARLRRTVNDTGEKSSVQCTSYHFRHARDG